MSLYVATYDVSDDRRRNRVARVLLAFGHRVRWSVFVIDIAPDDLPDLRRQIGEVLSREDQFDLFPIDERGTRSQWRWQRPIEDYEPVIVV